LLIDSGACRPCEILKTFGVSKSSVDRALRKYRAGGIEAFFLRKGPTRRGRVLTEEVLHAAQHLLDSGMSKHEVGAELNIHYDTLRYAVWDGRLREPDTIVGSTQSDRSVEDAQAASGMGTACTRVEERVLAALGQANGASTRFECCLDVSYGGVLCALPALLAQGLLSHAHECLGELKGYYTTIQILLLLAIMALCRIKTVEQLRGKPPGELGKLLGLDRIPECRCLRNKADQLSENDNVEEWGAHLFRHWTQANADRIGTYYFDGHVRVYHGRNNPLPKKFVSRQRLCLRGTTDYWLNDAIGQPFFVIDKVVDSGLLQTLREDIVPRLLNEIPHQPSPQELEDNPLVHRFILVFDREGYSPAFFQEMWSRHRIACITYHKFPTSDWPKDSFVQKTVTMPSGENIEMKLAERGTLVGSGKQTLWMKEVRKLTDSGHQTSLISTAYALDHDELAARLFSRWCQENFFRYAMQHFAIDLLSEYGGVPLHDTEMVVNPAWRQLDRQRNSLAPKIQRRQARFAQLTPHPSAAQDMAKHRKWVKRKSELLEEIVQLKHELEQIKLSLKQVDKHIPFEKLDEKDRFQRPLLKRKRLMDTVRMIAYRAETAMCAIIQSPTIDLSDARRIMQDLFNAHADLHPVQDEKRLEVIVHRSARPAVDLVMQNLFDQLNETETQFPGTQLTMRFQLAGSMKIENGGIHTPQR